MSIEDEIKDAFGQLATEVRTSGPRLEGAMTRARRQSRRRNLAYGSLGLAMVVALAVAVPRLMNGPRRGVEFPSGPATFLSDPTAPPSAPGLHLELSFPSQVATAEILEATLRIRDDAGSVSEQTVLWGETPGRFPTMVVDCVRPPTGAPPSGDETRVLRHAYRAPGTYTIAVKVWTGHCQATDVEEKIVEGTITVVQGATPSNGPLAPVPHIEDRRNINEDPGPGEVAFFLGGKDEDGFVRRLVVDWGDGNVEVLVDAPLSNCEETPILWPSTYLDGREANHVYPPGTFTLTVTVTSVGCAGDDVQTQSDDFVVTIPA
jgi:hypothetical protein